MERGNTEMEEDRKKNKKKRMSERENASMLPSFSAIIQVN